jgi:two-component system response regulator FixJ
MRSRLSLERTNQGQRGNAMLNLSKIKITQRDEQVLKLLVQGCSNKEIAAQLKISPRTVKQHLRTLFLRAGIRDGRKRVKLATAMFRKEQMGSCNPANG